MGSKKLEVRQKVEADAEQGQEIAETGEQKIKEAEESMLPFVGGLEIIDDDTTDAVEEARKESRAVCGLGGISEKEIIEPTSDKIEPLLSAIDEAADLQSCFREAEEELAQTDNSTTELSIEDLAKLFDF